MSAISSSVMSGSLPMTSAAERGLMSSMNGNVMSKGSGSTTTASADQNARVAEDFEGVFASLLLKEMRKTLEPGTLFGEDSGDVYGGLFDMYLGQQMTQSGGFGLAKMVRESMERTQRVNVAG